MLITELSKLTLQLKLRGSLKMYSKIYPDSSVIMGFAQGVISLLMRVCSIRFNLQYHHIDKPEHWVIISVIFLLSLMSVSCSVSEDSDVLMVKLSEKPYTSAKGEFSIQLPSGWTVSEIEGILAVDAVESPDNPLKAKMFIDYEHYDHVVTIEEAMEIDPYALSSLANENPDNADMDSVILANIAIYEIDSQWVEIHGNSALKLIGRKSGPYNSEPTWIWRTLEYRITIDSSRFDISYMALEGDFEHYRELFEQAVRSLKSTNSE